MVAETQDPQTIAYLLDFFRLLADEKRLQIVGLLARQDHSVEELAASLNLSQAGVYHHLRRLVKAGLAQAGAGQPHPVYSLQLHTLRDMSQQILSRDDLQGPAEDPSLDGYDRKVLRDYVAKGRLRTIPRQRKKRNVILRYLMEQFEPGQRYTEPEVKEIINQFHDDHATLRRELVDNSYLARERGVYWRVA
jgi:hypothetical protein